MIHRHSRTERPATKERTRRVNGHHRAHAWPRQYCGWRWRGNWLCHRHRARCRRLYRYARRGAARELQSSHLGRLIDVCRRGNDRLWMGAKVLVLHHLILHRLLGLRLRVNQVHLIQVTRPHPVLAALKLHLPIESLVVIVVAFLSSNPPPTPPAMIQPPWLIY